MHKKAKWLISTLLTLITPAALKSQSPEGQNPHGISIESLCSKPNQQQIEMLTRFAEERGLVFSRKNCASLVENILKKGFFDPIRKVPWTQVGCPGTTSDACKNLEKGK